MTDGDLVSLDMDTVEAGYPVSALNRTILTAQERFRGRISQWGEGDNWSDANPHDLADAVARNARSAAVALEDDDHTEAKREVGDALNYLLFLRDVISARTAEGEER